MASPDDTQRLARAWLAACPPGSDPRLVETHISWVILTGRDAWKIKKPVRLDFLDFSTLEARRHACEEELRLNRRLAPAFYHGVVPITGSVDAPIPGGSGNVIEYAVHMARFPDGAVVGEGDPGLLQPAHLDRFAAQLAAFHGALPAADPAGGLGRPADTFTAALASLDTLARVAAGDARVAGALALARAAVAARFAIAAPLLEERRRAGAVRECHGDLHLGNLALVDDEVVAFDALEFDPALRWTDVLNEVAFLVMDLDVHGRRDAALRFLNRYLDATGDHAGLPALPFLLAYRAIVRAKVRALAPGGDSPAGLAAVESLLRRAAAPLGGPAPLVVVMSGISGSGKSWLAFQLAEALPAIHLRSDVERRRLHGLAAAERTGLGPGEGIYAPAASGAVYARLGELAAAAATAGLAVIIDATCLRRAHRAAFVQRARASGWPVALVACHAADAVIARRVATRAVEGTDPSEAGMAVVARQRGEFEPPDAREADLVIDVDTGHPCDARTLAARLAALRPAAEPA